MEVWEAASALGVGEPERPTEDVDVYPDRPRPAMAAAGRSRAVDRMLEAKGLRGPIEPETRVDMAALGPFFIAPDG